MSTFKMMTEQITKYLILGDADIQALENGVNHHIQQGWIPQGGVGQSDEGIFIQAIVKKEMV